MSDDLELVAVITAAIAASTGSSPSGLVVRSIKRASARKVEKSINNQEDSHHEELYNYSEW